MADVELKRISLTKSEDLEEDIQTFVNEGADRDYRLVSTFVYSRILVLIFMKEDAVA